MNVVLLHPGAMGASIGAALRGNGHRTTWVAAGRSAATKTRAEQAGLRAAATLESALAAAELVVAVCPPARALEVARAVRAAGWRC